MKESSNFKELIKFVQKQFTRPRSIFSTHFALTSEDVHRGQHDSLCVHKYGHKTPTYCDTFLIAVFLLFENDFFPFSTDSISQNNIITKVAPLPDGQKVNSLKYKFRGDQYILRNKWGIYNFEYPAIWLREINDDKYTFAIFGPEGNWKIVNGNGFSQTSRQSGSMPATIVASKSKNEKSDLSLSLELEFIGVEFTDQFGNVNPRGKTFKFGF